MKFQINKQVLLNEGEFMNMVAKSSGGLMSIGNFDNDGHVARLKKMVSDRMKQNQMANHMEKQDPSHRYATQTNDHTTPDHI